MTKTITSIVVVDAEKRRVPSKHYVYVIQVKWSDGSSIVVYRRYSRFFDLQTQLLDKFPIEGGATDPSLRIIPFLPGKIFFGRSQVRDVAMKRLGEIDAYCKSLLSLPSNISQCEDVLEFFEVEPEDLEPPKEEAKHKSGAADKKVEKISGPKQLAQFMVIADYEAQEKGEISLQAGVTVEVFEKSESGWWFVNAEEHQGWVPSTYLQPLDGAPTSQSTTSCARDGEEENYICIERYEAMSEDELTLEKGVLVKVIQKNEDGWWLVRYQGKDGIAPATYLKKSSDPHAINLVEKSRQSGVQIISNLAAVSNIMAGQSSPRNSTSSPRNSGFLVDNAHNSVPSVANIRNSAVSNMTAGEEEDEWDEEERDMVYEAGPKGDSYTKVILKSRSLERGGSLKPPPRQNSFTQLNLPVSPPPPPSKATSTYVTAASFEDTVGDGISFGIGEILTVLEKTSTGWWFVRRGEDEGWVPETYLEPAGDGSKTNGEHTSRPSAPLPKPPEKKTSKPPALPSKPVESSEAEEPTKPNQMPGIASAPKSKFGSKAPPNLPMKPADKPGPPPPPPNKPVSSADISEESSAPVAGLANALKSKFDSRGPPSLPVKPANKAGPPSPLPKNPGSGSDSEMDGSGVGGGVLGLANALRSKFESQLHQEEKPVLPASKPAPPAKVTGGGAATGRPAPPQKPGAVPHKPPATMQKPSLPFKKPEVDSNAGSSHPTKLQLGGPPKLPSGQASGPPKLPSGPPKLPSKPPGHKHSHETNTVSDIPPSTNRVSSMAAALSGKGAGVDNSGSNGRPSLPGKKPQPPAQKSIPGGSEGGQNKPKVGSLVSELSGKLNFGAGGGGGAKMRSPEPSPVSKSGPGMWSGTQGADDASNFQPVAVFPGMAALNKPSAIGAGSPPKSAGSRSARYEAVADYDAVNEGEVSLACGEVVEVLDKQEEWWLVNSRGVEGWAPANYLQPV